MYLILFTIIYSIITQFFDLNPSLTFAAYLVTLSMVKGLFNKELKDVFNFKKTSYLYEKFGFTDSLSELISLILIYINYSLMAYIPFSFPGLVVTIFILAITYRFLFWGITFTLRNPYMKKSNKI